MNTALLVEPRFLERLPGVIENFRTTLGPSWQIIFYCGKGLATKWQPLLHSAVILRELTVTNFNNGDEHSDFFKQKSLWESLIGEWVLTFQADTWLISTNNPTNNPYTIDYFLKKNKSFVGGNMKYLWVEMEKVLRAHPFYRNFNGGLSLRKREHMIEIIEAFPPEPTEKYTPFLVRDPEDVYFTEGCYLMGFPVGDDEDSSHFAVHTIFKEQFFGIHQPDRHIRPKLIELYPEIEGCYLPTETIDYPLYLPKHNQFYL